MNNRNLKLTLQYDGTDFHGFQIQPVAVTVQKCIEDALCAITSEDIKINGCSRTDAGVHAVKYVCSFFTAFPIPAERLPIVLNHKLPDSIKALECCEVTDEFHARFDTSSKIYRYIINTDVNPNVFSRNYEWQLRKALDVEKMQSAAKYIEGEHDFKCFMSAGGSVQSTVRTVYSVKLVSDDSRVVMYIKANGYLYNMVRIITGTLVNVGLGIFSPEYVKEIIESKLREKACPTAPPQGLYLYDVQY